jgi:hypothetical protein
MGCDIHLFTEVKINSKWYCHAVCEVQRDYDLFYKMAGVRGRDNDTVPISLPKGLPDDISDVTKAYADYWDGDGHSYSWLNSNEILELEKWVECEIEERRNKSREPLPYDYPEKRWGYLFGNPWGDFINSERFDPENIEDIRFVFWFDN